MKTLITLPTITRKDFIKKLTQRPFENLKNIEAVENFLKKQRGYVFRMPKRKTPVILLVSGGLDSIITWSILLEKYQLEIYPLFIHRGTKRSKKEEAAALFFAKYYAKKYPKLSHPLMKFSTKPSPTEIVDAMKDYKNYYHPQRLLELIKSGQTTVSNATDSYPLLPFFNLFYCLAYADYLYDRHLKKITTIFTGIMAGDGTAVPSQSLTAVRNALLAACSATANYTIQYSALAIEKELGFWFEKSDYIKIGVKLHLPLEKTWSCYHANKYQCGDACLACQSRRFEFAKAQVKDKTIYAANQKTMSWYLQRIQKKAMLLLRKV